jgi:hypothetical protein
MRRAPAGTRGPPDAGPGGLPERRAASNGRPARVKRSLKKRPPLGTMVYPTRLRASSALKARMLHVLRFPCEVSRISPFVAVSSSAASTIVTRS